MTDWSMAVIAAALMVGTLGVAPAGAQAFQQHKAITLVIAGSVGSAYNSYGRVLAHHMKRHIPGDPDIIVKNIMPLAAVAIIRSTSPTVRREILPMLRVWKRTPQWRRSFDGIE